MAFTAAFLPVPFFFSGIHVRTFPLRERFRTLGGEGGSFWWHDTMELGEHSHALWGMNDKWTEKSVSIGFLWLPSVFYPPTCTYLVATCLLSLPTSRPTYLPT
jgi:hypothetical protein